MDMPLQKSNPLHLAVDQHQAKATRFKKKKRIRQEKDNYKQTSP